MRVDILLWLALIAAAAALRLARLDALPLTFDESARAFDALRASEDAVPEGWSGDLATALTSYLFRVFGDSDFTARLVPAVAGSAMVAALSLGGRVLGRGGALTAGALLAFSPLALLASRSALPFSAGGLLAVGMTVALLSYLRQPRALAAFLFAVSFGLAPSTDAVGTTAAIAVLAFLVLEPVLSRESEVARAWGVFRRSPSHWLSVGLVLIGALELGITHFGTFVGDLELAGVAQWRDMFATPRDGRPTEYQLALLLAYDWPLVLFGGTAVGFFVWRLRRRARALTSPQRFLLLWTALAAVVVALTNQREAGQLLILLLPLAMLAGLLAEQLASALDWAILRRWWPVAAAALALLAYAALRTNEWSHPDITIPGSERFYLVLAVGGAAALLATGFFILGRHAATVSVTFAAVVALAFLIHTDLALTSDDEGVEFAMDIRATSRVEQFRETLDELAASRAGPILVDPSLQEPLAWELRDLAVTFAEATGDAGALVVPGGQEVEGFTPLAEPWRLGESWYPPDLDPLRLWRWLVYREPYGNLEGVDAQILVPAP